MKRVTIIAALFFVKEIFAFQPVDINQASVEQIALLPGVGKKLAEHLVILRKRRGSFSKLKDLSEVSGMTAQKIEQIKPHVIFLATKTKLPAPLLITLPKKPVVLLSVLEQAALTNFGLLASFDQSLSNRARKAFWLPKFSALFDVDTGHTSAKTAKNVQDSVLSRDGREFGIGVRAIFEFDKLIFNSDELEVAKLFLKRLEKQEEIISKLHRNYFHYLRLNENLEMPLEREAASSLVLKMTEIEAVLDFMTNGQFTFLQRKEG